MAGCLSLSPVLLPLQPLQLNVLSCNSALAGAHTASLPTAGVWSSSKGVSEELLLLPSPLRWQR